MILYSHGKQNKWQLIIALSKSLKKIHQKSDYYLMNKGLTHSQFEVLEALKHKGELSIKALIDTVLSTSGNMTVVIRNLNKQGYIISMTDPKDKRSTLIRLSDTGKVLIDACFKKHMEYVKASLNGISNEEKNLATDILRKVK